MPFTSLGNVEGKAAQRRNEIKEAFHRIIDLAVREKVDFLLICGDLYEHGYVKKSTINFVNEEFGRIQNTRVILLPGNHDPYLPASAYRTIQWPDNVYILAEGKELLEFEEQSVSIYGSLNPSLRSKKASTIDILMLHGTLNMSVAKNAFNPFTSEELDKYGMDYIALGHFHNRFETKGKMRTAFNPGSPEPLGFDEEGDHGVFITEIFQEEDGTRRADARFVSMNIRNYRNIDVNCEGCGSDERTASILAAVMKEAGGSNDLFSITLKGTVEKGYKADIGRLEAILARECFFVRIKDTTSPGYDLDEIVREPGIRGLFVKKMLERIRQAELSGDETDRALAQEALYYGIQAMEQGGLCL